MLERSCYHKNMKKSKRSRDPNQMAVSIVAEATGGKQADSEIPTTKNPAAVELGRLGGLKGGKARAQKLSPKRRSDIAREAAKKRWR